MPALVGEIYYPGNSDCLKQETHYDFMGTDIMPQFFYRDTLVNARNHILHMHGNVSFEDAWKIFARKRLSPVNVLSTYAITHEPSRYKLVLPNDTVGMISVASNRPVRSRGRLLHYSLFLHTTFPFIVTTEHLRVVLRESTYGITPSTLFKPTQ
jgi:hypothetical protein